MSASTVRQDGPPRGGYSRVKYARNLPMRGPSGVVLLLAGVAVMAYGLKRVGEGNRKRRYFLFLIGMY